MIVIAAVVIAAAAAVAAIAAEPMFAFPAGAFDIRQKRFPDWQTDAFLLRVPYPAPSVQEHFEAALAGWRRCKGDEEGWRSFVVDKRRVHQLDRQWINAADDTTVVVSMRYTSKGPTPREQPDTDRLSVVVSRHEETAAQLYRADVVCDGYTPPPRAGNICWVRTVEKHPEGLRVFFDKVSRLIVRVKRAASASAAREIYVIKEDRDHIVLKDGDTASLGIMEHDNCEFSASDQPDRSGLLAISRMWLPGLRPRSEEQFIEAVAPSK